MDLYVKGDLVVKARLEDGEDGTLTILIVHHLFSFIEFIRIIVLIE